MLTGFTTGFVSMAATRIVMGMGESTSWPACNRVIREWFPASERGVANAIFGAGAAAGPAIGAVLVSAVVAWLGWRAGFFVAGGIGFIWLAAWLVAFDKPERATWLRQAERDKILGERDGETRPAPRRHGASPLLHLLTLRSVWGLFLTQGCEVYGGYMLLTWLPSYLQTAKGLVGAERRHADRGAVRRRDRRGRRCLGGSATNCCRAMRCTRDAAVRCWR